MNYVRRLKRESGIVGNLRLVALMIAWRIKTGHTESRPVSHAALARDTGLDRKTVKGLLKRIIAFGLVSIGTPGRGRGQFNTYVMPALAGPLFMVGGGDTEKGGDSPPFSPEKGGGFDPVSDEEKGGDSSPISLKRGAIRPKSVRTTCTSEDVRTSTTTARKPVAAVTYAAALEFLDWFAAAYHQHNNGARVTVDVEADGPLVVRLLTTPQRDVARLRAMALVMWTATAIEDPWVARATDRGLRLLNHAADRLERIAIRRSAPAVASLVDAVCLYRHDPPCSSATACAELERERLAREERFG